MKDVVQLSFLFSLRMHLRTSVHDCITPWTAFDRGLRLSEMEHLCNVNVVTYYFMRHIFAYKQNIQPMVKKKK